MFKGLDHASPQLFARGQIATIRAWEAKLSAAMAARCVELQLELAWDFELRWRFSEARGALKKARPALNSPSEVCGGSDDARSEFLTTKLAHRELMLMLLSDQAAETETLCRRWLAQSDGSERFMHASTETALM
jgi:LuxR family maltose regulon positive regulatory protein